MTRWIWCSLFTIFLSMGSALAQKTVSGKVTDPNGAAVAGASVVVKGGTGGTSTDADGSFSITVPAEAKTLVISAVGFNNMELPVDGTDFSNISLTTKANDLNEVVVIGYGTARKKDLTGAVAQVQAKDFNKGVFAAPDQLIQGKVAGVQIIQNSGAPGAGATIRIRGNSSIRAGSQPLFVVDGVPLDGGAPRPGVSTELGGSPGGNPLNFLNPADIASMEVLKDASAAAIYGSRGANGVVIITTKRGQSGTPKIEFNMSTGISNVLRKIDILDAEGYRAALRQYNITTGDLGGNADALGAILRTGIVQNYSASISGGNADGRYRLSLGYQDQEGIIRKTDFKRISAALNASYRFLNSKKLGLDVNIISSQNIENIAPISNNAGFQGSLIGQALQWNPTRNLRRANGTLDIDRGGAQVNPLAMSEAYDDRSIITNILASVAPSYKITKDLEFKSLYSVNYGTGTRRTQIASFINLQNIEDRGFANFASNELITNQWTNTLSYNKKISEDLNLNAVVGYEYMKFTNRGVGISGLDFINVGIPYTNMMQFTQQGTRGVGSFAPPISELQSYFARAILNYQDRFIFTGTLRADGSSKFGENNRYGIFPSVAGAWNVSNESFMQSSSVFSNFKVRASWGVTGNQEFPSGAAQAQFAFTGPGRFEETQQANPDLRWERTGQINAGIDFGLMNDRLTGSIDYYNRNTTDLLFNFRVTQPGPGGRYWTNLDGNVINKGVEIALNYNVLRSKDLTWDVGFNIAYNDNILKNYNGPDVNTGGLHGQGISGTEVQRISNNRPLNIFYTRDFRGINRDGQVEYANDGALTYLGNPNPRLIYGFTTSVTWKNLSITANMNGASGHVLYNNTFNTVLPIGNLGTRNIAANLMTLPTLEARSSPVAASSRYLESGNYIKMANATVNYSIGNVGGTIKNLNVFVNAQNLFLLTKFSGFDPEVNTDKSIDGFPSFGIEFTPYPSARFVNFGVNFSL